MQTNPKVIARCILMATDPGDLVIDPTCGGGTSALVAEQYGRRWITIDTSRVALAVARERLLTAVYDYYQLAQPERDVDGGFVYETQQRVTLGQIAKGEEPETVTLYRPPVVDKKKTRVSGPFTVEALSRYSVNPLDPDLSAPVTNGHTATHVEALLDALKIQGIPRPGSEPLPIESLSAMAAAEPLQAEGVVERDGRKARVRCLARTPVRRHHDVAGVRRFAGRYRVRPRRLRRVRRFRRRPGQARRLARSAGPTSRSCWRTLTFSSGICSRTPARARPSACTPRPMPRSRDADDGYRVEVLGLDSFDAATGATTSFGKSGIQAWFLDDDYDGTVFRVAQAFFPVTDAWEKLERALRSTVDAALLTELHGWTSLPFDGATTARSPCGSWPTMATPPN